MRSAGAGPFRRALPWRPGIELVPEPLWGRNLRALLPPSSWKKLRASLLALHGPRCAMCGTVEQDVRRIHAHEHWQYDADTLDGAVARVSGVELVCSRCHAVEHFGRLRLLHAQGVLEERVLHDVVAHFCRTNDATPAEFAAHEDEAVLRWRRWSAVRTWRVDARPFLDVRSCAV